jgi:hypothetical protein
MLEIANLTNNLILAGVGFATFDMRVFAYKHPEKVLGVVKKKKFRFVFCSILIF